MPHKDPVKRREYARRWMREHYAEPAFKKEQRKRVYARRTRLKLERIALLEAFRKQGCIKCGEYTYCCLDAHHKDPTLKNFSIGLAPRMVVSTEAFKKELDNCVCICSNCHRKLHAGIISL